MNIANCKIAFLGDSITNGVGVSSNEKIYLNLLRDRFQILAYNYGVSATRIACQRKTYRGYVDWDENNFIARAAKIDITPDIVVVFGGTNDFGHGDAPIGTIEDRDPYTFFGALHTLYTQLMHQFPDALIVPMTPLHRANENNPYGDWDEDSGVCCGILRDYVNAIRQVAEYYSLPVCDLFATSGIVPAIPENRERYCPDGLHPNDRGHEIIASRLSGFLTSL